MKGIWVIYGSTAASDPFLVFTVIMKLLIAAAVQELLVVFTFLCKMRFTAMDFGRIPNVPGHSSAWRERVQAGLWRFLIDPEWVSACRWCFSTPQTVSLSLTFLLSGRSLLDELSQKPRAWAFATSLRPGSGWSGTLLSSRLSFSDHFIRNAEAFSSGYLPVFNLTRETLPVANDPNHTASRVRETRTPLCFVKVFDSRSGIGFLWPRAHKMDGKTVENTVCRFNNKLEILS